MLESHKNRNCGGQVTRPRSSQPSICGNHPHFRTFPRVKIFIQGFWVTRVSDFYAVRTVGKRRQKRTCMRSFNSFTGRISFYRTSAVLFTGDGESEKIEVGILKNLLMLTLTFKTFFFIKFSYFFQEKLKLAPYPTIKPPFLIHF